MQPFRVHTGRVAALPRANVDTDQIIPKQFLKRIERTGFGVALFHDWRYRADGTPEPAFELNRPEAAGASVLLTGANFGCGSSREHAPWALAEYGFRAIVAPSFADIFYGNCTKIGLLPVILDEAACKAIAEAGAARIDLDDQSVDSANTGVLKFEIDEEIKHRLSNGLDDIGVTLQNVEAIDAYEAVGNADRGPVTTSLA